MILNRLAGLLRVNPGDVEDVLRNDEARARDTVNRRRFMGAAAALASAPFVPKAWALPLGPPDLLGASFMATVYMSYDNGRTWTMGQQVVPEPPHSARFKIVPGDWS